MANVTYYTASGQPSFLTETQTGDYVVEYPLGAAEPTAIIVRAPFMQRRDYYARPAANLLLSYGGVTNYLTYSEQIDNAAWSKPDLSVGANSLANPVDGSMTADAVVETATTATHGFTQAYTYTSASAHAMSLFAKAGARTWIQMNAWDGSANHSAFFNINSGTVGTTSGLTSSEIVAVGNGWYRCSIVFTPAAALGYAGAFLSTDGAVVSYLGDVTKGATVYGVQLEMGSTVGRYVATTNIAAAGSSTNTYFVSDDNFGEIRGGIIEWQRTWASVPASWTEPEEYAFIYPAYSGGALTGNVYNVTAIAASGGNYNISASTSNITAGNYVYVSANYTRNELPGWQSGEWSPVISASGSVLTVRPIFLGAGALSSVTGTVQKGIPGRSNRPSIVVGSSVVNDYALTNVTAIDTDLPLFQPFNPVDSTGTTTGYLTTTTQPTAAAYASSVMGNGILVVECTRRRYIGNIYVRKSRRIPTL